MASAPSLRRTPFVQLSSSAMLSTLRDKLVASVDRLYDRESSSQPDLANAQRISLDGFVEQAAVGDVVLFQCNSRHHSLVRAVCYSPFDHVGVVAINDQGDKVLLESCVIGCVAFDLEARVRQYLRHMAHAVAWRKLVVPTSTRDPLQTALTQACARFVEEVDGKPYDYSVMKIFFTMRKSASDASEGDASERAYYCSEIVAALYQRCGLLSKACNAASFWPGDLADGGVCERWLAEGVKLEPMVLLED